MAVDKDRLYKKLDHVGEQRVREKLANADYTQKKRRLVEKWLRQFNNHHDRRKLLS